MLHRVGRVRNAQKISLASHLGKLQERFPVSRKPELASALYIGRVPNSCQFIAGFVTEKDIRHSCSRTSKILTSRFDPFCGCGTTLLASSFEGIDSFGVDLNPLATFSQRPSRRGATLNQRPTSVFWAKRIWPQTNGDDVRLPSGLIILFSPSCFNRKH